MALIRAGVNGAGVKGPLLKEKRTFWESRMCSKSTTSLAEDKSSFTETLAEEILLYKWKNSASIFSNFSEPAL